MARYIDAEKFLCHIDLCALGTQQEKWWPQSRVVEMLDALPTEDVAPVAHGHWIYKYDENGDPFLRRKYYCSVCNDWQTYGKPNYCPNCGAKIEEEK